MLFINIYHRQCMPCSSKFFNDITNWNSFNAKKKKRFSQIFVLSHSNLYDTWAYLVRQLEIPDFMQLLENLVLVKITRFLLLLK